MSRFKFGNVFETRAMPCKVLISAKEVRKKGAKLLITTLDILLKQIKIGLQNYSLQKTSDEKFVKK